MYRDTVLTIVIYPDMYHDIVSFVVSSFFSAFCVSAVARALPWCCLVFRTPDVRPQLYADNLKCSAERPGALFDSARFTAQYVRSVGQDVSLGKCVLLSNSKSVRKAMKLWDISGDGGFWKVQLDVRDLGGHLDFTYRARAGTLSKRIGEATVGVASVGALSLGFQVKLGLVRGKYLLAGLHAAEASYVSSSAVSAVRAAIGLLKCLLPAHLLYLISLMGLLVLILLFISSGPGFA